jgi:CCR4-NOT transcription complex subunit 7/8
MPPPANRYGQQAMNGPFHIQQNHMLQQHPQAQQHHAPQHNSGLPPPIMGGNPGFGLGNANSNASPFSIAGSMNSGGFDRGLADSSGAGLGSHAAQMSFARGGPVHHNAARDFDGMPLRETKQGARIRNVWKTNLAAEMETLRQLVEEYPYIAMVPRPRSAVAMVADTPV